MEVKVGQWVRNGNEIFNITDIFWKDTRYFYSITNVNKLDLSETMEHNFWGLLTNKKMKGHDIYITLRDYNIKDNLKVANTPQELVQVGDLIYSKEFTNYGKQEVISKLRNKVDTSGGFRIDIETISTILTPDSNGGYDLQYSKEND